MPQTFTSCFCSKQGESVCVYRRRIGRWLTDVTPLMPLLTGQRCHFHLQTAPWALTWTPSLTLRFTNTTHPRPMGPDVLQPGTDSCHAEEEDLVSRLPRKLQSAASSNSAGTVKSSLTALPLADMVAGAKTDAAGAKTDAAGATIDAFGAKRDAAGAKTDTPTPSQSQGVPIITATSPSIFPPSANFSPAKSETAQQPGAEQSQEADVTATPEFEFAVRRPKPHSIVPLFDGGDFDAGYNDKYKPVEFVTPAEMQKAVLEAVITGTSYGMRHDPLWTHASCLIGSLVCMWYARGTHVVSMCQCHKLLQTWTCMRETRHAGYDQKRLLVV